MAPSDALHAACKPQLAAARHCTAPELGLLHTLLAASPGLPALQLVKLETEERLALGAGKPYERHLP